MPFVQCNTCGTFTWHDVNDVCCGGTDNHHGSETKKRCSDQGSDPHLVLVKTPSENQRCRRIQGNRKHHVPRDSGFRFEFTIVETGVALDEPVIPPSSQNRGHNVSHRIGDVHETDNDRREVVRVRTVGVGNADVGEVDAEESHCREQDREQNGRIAEEDQGVKRPNEAIVKTGRNDVCWVWVMNYSASEGGVGRHVGDDPLQIGSGGVGFLCHFLDSFGDHIMMTQKCFWKQSDDGNKIAPAHDHHHPHGSTPAPGFCHSTTDDRRKKGSKKRAQIENAKRGSTLLLHVKIGDSARTTGSDSRGTKTGEESEHNERCDGGCKGASDGEGQKDGVGDHVDGSAAVDFGEVGPPHGEDT